MPGIGRSGALVPEGQRAGRRAGRTDRTQEGQTPPSCRLSARSTRMASDQLPIPRSGGCSGNIQKDLSAALRMCDSFFDGGEGVGPGHWYVRPAGGDHRRRLHDCWRILGAISGWPNQKPFMVRGLKIKSQRADGHRPAGSGRPSFRKGGGLVDAPGQVQHRQLRRGGVPLERLRNACGCTPIRPPW